MLQNNFYAVEEQRQDEKSITAVILLDAAHEIFKGHFPGQPVLPGVCMIQIVKDFMEEVAAKELLMSRAGSCKFLSLVDPGVNDRLTVTVDYVPSGGKGWEVSAVLKGESHTFFKMNAFFEVPGSEL